MTLFVFMIFYILLLKKELILRLIYQLLELKPQFFVKKILLIFHLENNIPTEQLQKKYLLKIKEGDLKF